MLLTQGVRDDYRSTASFISSCRFTPQIIADSQKAKDALRDIEARHEELLALEKSIVEVRDLFVHLALLVETQVSTLEIE